MPIDAPRREAPADPESEVVARAQGGDVQAFGRIYHAYAGRVHALCWRISGNRQRAEELTQEVFVRAWRNLHAFQGRSRFFTWLYRIAVNLATDALRADRRREEREMPIDRIDAWADDVSQAIQPAAPPLEPETRLALEAAVATLPAGARAVFVLHDVEGFRHDEIAQALGIATGTSKAQLHRARRLLRQKLGDHDA
jgi:RNA polymerase sigma-70 factor (ECF subfamily)